MNSANGPSSCPKCQAPLAADAPQGLCAKCLLAAAAAPSHETYSERPGGEAAALTAQVPPVSLEQVTAAFPQLEILELIGQGGMGVVFKARQPKLERLVALKILPQSLAADPAFAERFLREGRVLARLNHPNIVTVHDFGQSGGFFYLLMEYVDGVNLRQAMQAGRFTPAQALALVPKICDALQFAHDEGILHRDIKPENILLDTKGRVKITDFGIAKLLGDNTATHTLTGTGRAIGTPHYMAPEQLEHPQDVDPRADIYSLGVVFYEMLTGELPLGRFAPPSAKAPVDPRVDEVVLRALERERDKRYRTATEVKTRVEAIRESVPVGGPARPRAAPDPALQKYHRRHRWRQGAAWGAGLLFLLAGLGLWQGPWREALRRRASPPGRNLPEGTVVIERIELSPDAAVPGLEKLRFRYRADPEHAVVFYLERKVGTNATVDRELSGHVVPPAGQAAEGTVEWTIRTGESMSPQGAGLTRWDFVLRGNNGETRGGYWTNDFANIQSPDFSFAGSVGPIRGFGVLVHRGWMQPLELPQRQLTLGVHVVPIPEDLRNRVAMAPTRGTNLALSFEMIRTARPQHVLKTQSAENLARPTEREPQPKP